MNTRLAAAVGWIACIGVAGVAAWQHDGRVALPGERVLWGVAVLGGHLAAGLGWTLVCAAVAPVLRWVPRIEPALPAAVLIVWLTVLPGGSPPLPRADRVAHGPNILLVSLDTLRADHVGAGLTPAIDALAAQGAAFDRAYATAPLTAPSHASMLTGLDVWEHGLVSNGRRTDGSVVPELRAAGYRTGAFLSARVLDRTTGLDAGFEHFDDRWGDARLAWMPLRSDGEMVRRGDHTVDRFERWLASVHTPWFAWVHLYDPHGPYDPPGAFRPSAAALAEVEEDPPPESEVTNLTTALRGLLTGRPGEQRLLYAGEVRWTDRQVERLLAAAGPDAVVVLVGDHGESLGEHDYWFNHGARLWESTLHVPLVLRWPGKVAPGSRSSALVSVQDVAATLRAVTDGSPAPLVAAVGGRGRDSVTSFTTGQEARPTLGYRSGVGEWRRGPAAARRYPDGKLLVHRGAPPEWFDLTRDPHEATPLPVPPEHASAAAELSRWVAAEPEPLSEAQQAHLQALGYVE
ncbi:MAG: choline-sulfatase [Myxococcota bacterium]|jgi:choline-sulfatase